MLASKRGQTGSSSVEQLQAQLEALRGSKGNKGYPGQLVWKGGSQGKGTFTGNCDNSGKPGHKKADCYLPGGGAHKPGKAGGKNGGKPGGKGDGKKACSLCGMTNHVAKDCRASEKKKKKYRKR